MIMHKYTHTHQITHTHSLTHTHIKSHTLIHSFKHTHKSLSASIYQDDTERWKYKDSRVTGTTFLPPWHMPCGSQHIHGKMHFYTPQWAGPSGQQKLWATGGIPAHLSGHHHTPQGSGPSGQQKLWATGGIPAHLSGHHHTPQGSGPSGQQKLWATGGIPAHLSGHHHTPQWAGPSSQQKLWATGEIPFRTWVSESFESVQWNACVHRLDFGLHSHQKKFWGNGVRNHVNSMKNPLYQRVRGGLNLWRCNTHDSEPNTLLTELFWPSMQHVKSISEMICLHNCMWCQMQTVLLSNPITVSWHKANQSCFQTQSRYLDTKPTGPSTYCMYTARHLAG